MAIDKRKFNEKAFVEHVPMELFREFLAPWRESLTGLSLDELSADSLHEWLLKADDSYPAELMEALHRMNDVGTHDCFDRIIVAAKSAGKLNRLLVDQAAPPLPELVMRAYLYEREEVFNQIWNEEYLQTLTLAYERRAAEECPARVTDKTIAAFQKAVRGLVSESYRGTFCTVTPYTDVDGRYFVIRHGWWPERRSIIHDDKEAVIGYQPLKQDVIHYDERTGLLRMKTATRKSEEQDALRDAFAEHILGDASLFRHADATNLYTLEPLQRDGTGFVFGAGLMKDDVVQIVELKVARGHGPKRVVNVISKGSEVLEELANGYDKIDLHSDAIISAKLACRLVRNGRVLRKTITIKPPCICQFSTATHPDTFRAILEQNGFVVQPVKARKVA